MMLQHHLSASPSCGSIQHPTGGDNDGGQLVLARLPVRSCGWQLHLVQGLARPPGTSTRYCRFFNDVDTVSPPCDKFESSVELEDRVLHDCVNIGRGEQMMLDQLHQSSDGMSPKDAVAVAGALRSL